MAASVLGICNRALQKLGAKRISSLSEDSNNARAVNTAYDPCRQAELTAHPWNFAIKRAQLAASATAPLFGYKNAFPLPADYLREVYPDKIDNYSDSEWKIEGKQILTFGGNLGAGNTSPVLNFRYIWDVIDPTLMDALFRESLSSRIALEICEVLTQSNEKKTEMAGEYKANIAEARRVNALQKIPEEAAEDEYITVRL